MWQAAYSFIESANAVETVGDLNATFSSSALQYGFQKVFVGAATHPRYYGSDSPILHNTMPLKWIEHYLKSNYVAADPIMRNVASRNLPFLWSEAPVENKLQRTVLQEAKDVDMHDGVVIPVHGVNQDLFFVSLVSDTTEAARTAPLDQLRLMAVHLQTSYLRLAKTAEETQFLPPLLSVRERDCLTYCAVGKTSWEIGQILGISEKTVDFHLANASQKLDAKSRVFTVVKALRHGLIMP